MIRRLVYRRPFLGQLGAWDWHVWRRLPALGWRSWTALVTGLFLAARLPGWITTPFFIAYAVVGAWYASLSSLRHVGAQREREEAWLLAIDETRELFRERNNSLWVLDEVLEKLPAPAQKPARRALDRVVAVWQPLDAELAELAMTLDDERGRQWAWLMHDATGAQREDVVAAFGRLGDVTRRTLDQQRDAESALSSMRLEGDVIVLFALAILLTIAVVEPARAVYVEGGWAWQAALCLSLAVMSAGVAWIEWRIAREAREIL